jgi:hypothetical protein
VPTRKHLPADYTYEFDSPFLSEELFGLAEEWEPHASALASDRPLKGNIPVPAAVVQPELEIFEGFNDAELEDDELGDNELGDDAERELNPVLVDLAEKILAGEAPVVEQEVSPRLTRCFSSVDVAKVQKVYEDNTSAAKSNEDDRCNCIVMLNVALGQLLPLRLKKHPARSRRKGRRVKAKLVEMGDLTTESIETAMKELRQRGFTVAPRLMDFLDQRNRRAGTLKPQSLERSVRDWVLAASKTQGCWFAFAMSIMDGYHSVLLLVDHTATDAKIYWLDQYSGGLNDDVTVSLDQKLIDRTQAFWQGVMDESNIGHNTTIRLWPLRKPVKPRP